jgi:outer membrane protein, heavy metal efflux system
MKIKTLVILYFILSVPALAQDNIEKFLAEIEKNNSGLKAARKHLESTNIGNKTGIFPENPEISLNYLWGSPSAIGNRTGLEAIQKFDFPSVYRYKKKMSILNTSQQEIDFQRQRVEILYQAKIKILELIYLNALGTENKRRLELAMQLANSYQAKFEKGETNILERNKAQINLLNGLQESDMLEVERNATISELTMLNGGNPFYFNDSIFPKLINLPEDFELWFAAPDNENPEIQYLNKGIEASLINQKLSTAMSLPKLSAGYMSEKTSDQKFQGMVLGISIPLWENKNQIKYAKSQTFALQSYQEDATFLHYNRMKSSYLKAVSLLNMVNEYKTKHTQLNNFYLLKMSLDSGQISLIEFIMEQTFYYESIDKMLRYEHELHKVLNELYRYSL